MAQVKAGRIVIDISAGTAQMIADLEKGNNALNNFGNHAKSTFKEAGHASVTGVQATSGALRVLEGQMANNIRAAERFLVNVVGLGGAMKAIFPLVGGIALGGFVVEGIERTVKAFQAIKEAKEAPERVALAFNAMTDSIRVSNDELRITDDRLKNDIAKLQGKPQNALKLMLDEARLAADKLAESLDKDLANLQKLLKENNVAWWRRLMGEGGTGDLQEQSSKLQTDISGITHQGAQKIREARTEKEKDAAQTEMNARITKRYADEIANLNREIAASEKDSHPTIVRRFLDTRDVVTGRPKRIEISPLVQQGRDERDRLTQLRKYLADVEEISDSVGYRQDVARDQAEKAKLEAEKEAADIQRPYQNKLRTLQADVDAAQAKSAAAGKGFSAKEDAAAFAEAQKVLSELNNELARHGQHLTAVQEAKIRSMVATKEAATADAQWKDKLSQLNSSLSDRIRGQELLAQSIGKGFEAARKAAVEIQLMQELGERFNDPKWMQAHAADVASLRTRIGQSYDAEHGEQTAQALDKIRDQIELQRNLAKAQMEGAEAVRQAELQFRLDQIAKENNADATKKVTAAERELYAAQRANQSAENLAKLNLEIDATRRLAAVQLQGAEATRRAELQVKYDKMRRDGATPEEIQKTRGLDEAEHQKQVTAEALKTGLAYQNQLESIAQQIEMLKQLRAEQGDSLAIEISLHNLEKERARVMSEQAQQLGTAMEGMKAYFREMAASGESAAKQVHDSLSQAFSGINDNLAKLISGQKVSWAGFFQEQSAHLAKMGLQNLESNIAGKVFGGLGKRSPMDEKGPGGILGSLGGLFGGGVAKRDGSSPTSALYVTVLGGDMPGMGGGLGSLFGKAGAGADADASGGGLMSPLGTFAKFGGFFAEGGDVDPGNAYIIGERGPEMFMPQSRGTIVPNHALGSGKAGDIYIDARNNDPAAVRRNVEQGMRAAHNAAVRTSFKSYTEYQKRTPQKSH